MSKKFQINKKNSNWNFKGDVYKNFDKHIQKSVPYYKDAQEIFLGLSDFFLQDKSRVIDLGCSTGTFINLLYERHIDNEKKISFEGLDTVHEMILECKKKYKKKNLKFKNLDNNKYNRKNA